MTIRFPYVAVVSCLFAVSLSPGSIRAQDAIKPTGEVELVQGEFGFTEGPAWDADSKSLYFSDIPNSTIHRLKSDGTIDVFTDDSKHTNGIIITSDGRMLGCQMDGQVVEYDKEDASAETLAGEFGGRRFNAPNDLIMDKTGGFYFTDPLFRAPTPLPQTVQAVYYVSAEGKVSRVSKDLPAPNGIGLSPDGNKLYVCPSGSEKILVYEVKAPGHVAGPEVFCSVTQPDNRSGTGADGIALDVEGNVYITTNLGVQIYSSDGKQLGIVKFPEQPANVTFGGEDWKTMFVTARNGLYRVTMPIAGLH